MTGSRCENCANWHNERVQTEREQYGTCRYNAPVINGSTILTDAKPTSQCIAIGAWPWTTSLDWCSRYHGPR